MKARGLQHPFPDWRVAPSPGPKIADVGRENTLSGVHGPRNALRASGDGWRKRVHTYNLIAAALIAYLAITPLSAKAQSPDASQAQDLTNCAGAVAALGGYDVLTFAGNENNEWGAVLARIMAAMNSEPGVEGMTGRYAASAARGFWAERPRAEQETQARSCRERFGSN